MESGDSIEPAAGHSCRGCARPLPANELVCSSCGFAHGEQNRCPHCHVVADVAAHPALGFECRVCGGPRVRLGARGLKLGAQASEALRTAGREQARVLTLSGIGWFLTGAGLLAVLVAVLVVLAAAPGPLATTVALVVSVLPSLAGVLALRRAQGARAERALAVQRAELAAAADVVQALGEVNAARLAVILGTAEARAELLLAEVNVSTFLEPPPAPLTLGQAPSVDVTAPFDASPSDASATGRKRVES